MEIANDRIEAPNAEDEDLDRGRKNMFSWTYDFQEMSKRINCLNAKLVVLPTQEMTDMDR